MRVPVLLCHLPRWKPGPAEAEALEVVLERVLSEARGAWPGVTLSEEAFLRHLGERLCGEEPLASLTRLHASDLYLACACGHGHRQALASFDDRFLSQVPVYLGRKARESGLSDEVRQALMSRLLVPEAGRPPRIWSYTGRGPLAGWVRMAAARAAADARREERPLPSSLGGMGPPSSAGPESAAVRAADAPELLAALEATLGTLSDRDATILRLHYFQGVPAPAIARIYAVSARSVQRWLADTRELILARTRQRLKARLGGATGEVDSLMLQLQSQVDLSISRLLRREAGG